MYRKASFKRAARRVARRYLERSLMPAPDPQPSTVRDHKWGPKPVQHVHDPATVMQARGWLQDALEGATDAQKALNLAKRNDLPEVAELGRRLHEKAKVMEDVLREYLTRNRNLARKPPAFRIG